MNDRIAELESQLAFQEHTIQTLNDAIVDLGKTIDELRNEISHIHTKLADIDTASVIPQSEEKPPPHY